MIYLDNAATTKPHPRVIEAMTKVLSEDFGNPSSLHNLGFRAENIITDARKTIAKSLGAKDDKIYFTPTGTLANNAAILGYLRRNPRAGKKIMCSSVEHPSVYNVFEFLKNQNYEVLTIPIIDFMPDYSFIEENIDENTALISVMTVNNETGTVFDIKKIKDIINRKKLKTLIHTDLIQGYLKLPVNAASFGADMISISAHKIGGPKGIGGLYIRAGINIEPVFFGGGQEKGLFSGTENTVNIAGFKAAVENFSQTPPELYDLFLEKLDKKVKINSKNNLKTILNISLNIRSEIALHILESKNIYVSSGSACSQKKGEKNRVLKNFGFDKDSQDTAIRISFSQELSRDDILKAAKEINEIIKIK